MAGDYQGQEGPVQLVHGVSLIARLVFILAARLTPFSYNDPFVTPVEYSPSDFKIIDIELAKARRLLRPHLLVIQMLSTQFEAVKDSKSGSVMPIIRLMMRSLARSVHLR